MNDRLASLVEGAQRAMTSSGGNPIRLGAAVLLSEEGRRASVARVRVEDGPAGIPPTVIVKRTQPEPSDQDSTGVNHARQGFHIEAATLEFLSTLRTPLPFSPGLLGVDRDGGIIVLEDLGDGVSLADLVMGGDPQAAARGLHAYARTLGRLHAEAVGRRDEFAAISGKYFETRVPGWPGLDEWATAALPRFRQACASLNVPIDSAFDRDVESICAALAAPGPWLTFNVSDACPDNHVVVGDSVRFFDFEFSDFGHALLDGAYLRLPFPTCWCVSRLPSDLQAEAERIYRAELSRGCGLAADDTAFEEALSIACAYWTIATVSWTLERSLAEDDMWGLASNRQRHIYRLEALVQGPGAVGHLSGVERVAAHLAAVLRIRWPEIEAELPVYPAFR